MSIHTLYKQQVFLDKEKHQYFNQAGEEYMGFSRFFNFLAPKFDAEQISKHVARSEGSSQKIVLDKWEKTRDEGTRFDVAIKRYADTGNILDEDADLEGIIKHASIKYQNYHSVYSDLVVFSHKYRVGGEIDRLSLVSNRKDSSFHLSDFKRMVEIGYEHKGQKWLNAPFDYILNSKYNKISIQASFYAKLFSDLTERKCERLFIDHVIPVMENGKLKGHKNVSVPINYLKRDVEDMLEYFKDDILKALEPKTEIIIEDEF
jgi:hypothetical protein